MLSPALALGWLPLLAGCRGEPGPGAKYGDTGEGAPDSVAVADSSDSGGLDTGDSAADTGPVVDTGDSAVDTGEACVPTGEEVCGNGVDDDCDGTRNGCGWEGAVAIEDAGFAIDYEEEGQASSSAVAGNVDVDGDGFVDLLVGASCTGLDPSVYTCNDGAAGAIYVVRGGAARDLPADLSGAWARVDGVEAAYMLGSALVSLGDVDGDGLGEFASYTADSPSPPPGGALYVISGVPAGRSEVDDVAIATYRAEDDGLRIDAAAGGGDLSAAGVPDLAMREGGSGGGAVTWVCAATGRGTVTSASCGASVGAGEPRSAVGEPVRADADLTGDGIDDLVAVNADDCRVELGCTASSMANGAVYVLAGPIDADVSWADRDAELVGEGVYDAVGSEGASSVSTIEDFDGDGGADVGVLTPYWDPAHDDYEGWGAVYVVTGPIGGSASLGSASTVFRGPRNFYLGFCLAAQGDLDGDGRSDLAFEGSAADDPGSNAFKVVFGRRDGAVMDVPDAEFVGAKTESPGSSCGTLGDLDSDGYRDIVAGDVGYDYNADRYRFYGRTSVIFGREGW